MSDYYSLNETQRATVKEVLAKRIMPKDLETFCVKAMQKNGMNDVDSQLTARALITADMWGIHTHGTKQLRFLLRNFQTRQLDPKASPKVVSEGPSWALVDGRNAMPMVTSSKAMQTAVSKARATGVCYVGVRKSSHFAAAGYYANLAAENNMIGLAMCNTDPCVTVPGGRGMVIGSNPIAFAVPAGKQRSVLLDIATSAVSAAKVHAAKATGTEIPNTWLSDNDGIATTNPGIFPENGALLPMAGHKGYGLALLIEILSGALTGAAMLGEINSWVFSEKPVNQGHAFVAIDVNAMMPIEKFKARIDKIIQEIKGAHRAKGSIGIFIPGEREWCRYEEALSKGLKLPETVVDSLIGLSGDTGIDFPCDCRS